MNKIIKYLLFTVALTPLFIDNLVFYPFTSAKNIFFRTVIILVSMLFIVGFIFVDKYRDEVISKIKTFSKNPLLISILAFILLVGVSVIFAFDKYTAFWGSLERGEGLAILIYSFPFLIFSLISFVKKDWLTFFKLSLFVSIIVLAKEFIQFFIEGLGRPESFFGNPTFLAGYLIFSLMFSIIVFSEEKKKLWKYFSIIIFILSILGIFIAETRGTILGLAVGTFLVLVYMIIKGKGVDYKKFNLRKISIIILSIIIAFSLLFIITRKSEVWQKVPGLSRIAVISLEDSTTSTRLLNQRIALKTVDPSINGVKVLLVGYGQDNFSYAYGKYFDVSQFEDEMIWFDRSHNKFLDILVMNGILGFIAYLSIFVICFIYLFKKKDFSFTTAGLLFGITAYLVHLFFIFDQTTTTIPLFATLAFIIYINSEKPGIKDVLHLNKSKHYIWGVILLFVFIISSLFVYFRNDLIAYSQMRGFTSMVKKGSAANIFKNADSYLYPITTSQLEIREKLFSITEKNFDKNNKATIDFSNFVILKGEEYLSVNPLNFIFKLHLANDYTSKGKKLQDISMLTKAENYLREVISYSPNRPDINYMLAINLFYQKKYGESFLYLEKSFDSSPQYYLKNKKNIDPTYPIYLKYFLGEKDLESVKKVAGRLDREYPSLDSINKLIDYIERTKTWPLIKFE